MSGEQWGQYVIDAKIGAGGMAEVFRGWRVGAAGFKREVCIKRIRSEHTENPDMLALFKDEANTGSFLRHRNIVSTDDVFEHDGRLSIVMEFVNGKNLREVENALRSAGIAMPLDAALYIAHELLAALQAAHTAVDKGQPLRIVHRDVSPANTLVSFTGEVKLTDFGIAHAATRMHQTAADQARGQPMYMPYEQLSGKVDARADLFAFGGVLFELLAGRLAFGDGLPPATPLAALAQKANDMRVSLATVRPDLPRELIALVDRMLSFHPDQRPASAQEALDVVCSLPEFSATGQRSMQLLMEQLYPSQGSIAAIPIDSALRNSRPSGVPAVRASSDPAMAVTAPDATIPDQRAISEHVADATSPARPAARTPRAAPVDAYAPTQARPSLLVVGDDVSAPPVNTAASDARDDRRGVPMWAIAMGAAVLLGASAVTITTMRNRGDGRATTPSIATSNEVHAPPPTTVLAPTTPSPNAGEQPAVPTMPPSTTQSAIAAPPVATGSEPPHANAPNAHNANPSHVSTTQSAVAAPTTVNAAAPVAQPTAPANNESNANHAGDEAPTQSAQTQSAPAAQTTGTLRVVALPWGEVFVDGTAHGRAPVSMRVSAGEHTVRITGGVEHTERVVVAAGATRTVTAEGE